MFTGIITDIGRIRSVASDGSTRFEIETAFDTAEIPLGASIACSGPCLTVVEKGPGWFAVEASAETLDRTTLGRWAPGTRVNLERALRLGDELGGHLVTGHVDGVARIVARRPEGDSVRFALAPPPESSAMKAIWFSTPPSPTPEPPASSSFPSSTPGAISCRSSARRPPWRRARLRSSSGGTTTPCPTVTR